MEKELRSGTRKEVLRAFEEAEKEKKPSLKYAFMDVWEELTVEQKEHVKEMRDIMRTYPKEYDVEEFEGGVAGLDELLGENK